MPVGTCDPATRGDPYNVTQLAVADGTVMVTIRYGWDGTSTRTGQQYTVQAVDTLDSIATQFGVTVADLTDWNDLPDTTVTAGQVLAVSRPGCDGPLVNGTGQASNRWAVSYTNAGQTTWYMHTVGKRGQPRVLTLAPGVSGTLTAQQAANAGYATISDCYDLSLTTTP